MKFNYNTRHRDRFALLRHTDQRIAYGLLLAVLLAPLRRPLVLGLAAPTWGDRARTLEHLTEVIVLLSLFTAGLKMSVGLHDRRWFPPLRLALLSMVVTVLLVTAVGVWLLGLPLGVAAALKRGSWFDQLVMTVATVGNSMPVFWWGLILIMFFSVGLQWTPVSGRVGIEFDVPFVTGFMLIDSALANLKGEEPGAFVSALLHLVLPATVLGTIPMAVIARMTRSSMLEVLREDYMRTARAKGLAPARVVVVHGLRNALIPVVTVLGLQVGSLLGGAVLTETIFSWPGIGKWLVDAIGRRDYPVVQAGILISALIFIAVNLVVDLLYGVVNPRMRAACRFRALQPRPLMARLTIRDLDDGLNLGLRLRSRSRLRMHMHMRSARHSRRTEEEARQILHPSDMLRPRKPARSAP